MVLVVWCLLGGPSLIMVWPRIAIPCTLHAVAIVAFFLPYIFILRFY